MRNIYFVRHGETNYNAEQRYQGKIDTYLNSKGKQQAEAVAKVLLDLDIDLIISSPKNRALETARIINNHLNLPLITEEGLKELNMGLFEGLTKDEIIERYPNRWKHHLIPNFNKAAHEGESAQDVQDRVFKSLDKVLSCYNNKNILFVSHGYVSKAVHKYFNRDLTDKQFFDFNLNNCTVMEYSH